MTPSESRLLSLPTELLLAVVDAIDGHPALRSFALTCKAARLLAEPILYRSLLITSGPQASSLAGALERRRPFSRAQLVKHLDLRPRFKQDEDLEKLTPLIETMTDLRALALESPWANYGRWAVSDTRWNELVEGYHAVFRGALSGFGLQNLVSLTLHWSGDCDRYWFLTEFRSILMLPVLQSLTISCALLDDDIAEGLDAHAGTTALLHLELIECYFSQKALAAVLSLPRALQSCSLGDVRDHADIHDFREASAEEQLAALYQQRRTLHTLTWIDEDVVKDDITERVPIAQNPGTGLREFTELRTLTLNGACALFLSTLLSERAPPNLERLRLIRHDVGTVLDSLGDIGVSSTHIPGLPPATVLHQYLPTLCHLDVVFSPEDSWHIEPLWESFDRRARVKTFSEELREKGIELSVFTALRGDVIPPYLFGEQAPEEVIAFGIVGDGPWFEPRMVFEWVEGEI